MVEFIVFGLCLTAIIAITIHFYNEQTKRAEWAVRSAYDRAAVFQQAAMDEIRLIRQQTSDERNATLGTVNHLVEVVTASNSFHDEQMRRRFDAMKVDLVNAIESVAAERFGGIVERAETSQSVRARAGMQKTTGG